MGTWMASNSMMQALMRALAPLALGVLYDSEAALPFWVTSGFAAGTLLCAGLLIARVPRPASTSSASAPDKSSGRAQVPAAREDMELGEGTCRLSHSADVDVHQLVLEYQRLMELKAAHESGQALLEDSPEIAVSEDEVDKLGKWTASMLASRGWTQHKMAVKAMILNGFPSIRQSPRIDTISDVLNVIAAHFEVERAWQDKLLARQDSVGLIDTACMYK